MKWLKSPEELVQAFDHCLPVVAGVQRKSMFGYPCAYVNGHLFCGLHQDAVLVRLPEARRGALVAQGASVFEPTPGHPMNEYVVAPAEIVADREKLRALLGEALAHASSLRSNAKAKGPRAAEAKKKVAPAKRKAAPAKKAPATKAPSRKARPVAKKAKKKAVTKKAARKTSPKNAKNTKKK